MELAAVSMQMSRLHQRQNPGFGKSENNTIVSGVWIKQGLTATHVTPGHYRRRGFSAPSCRYRWHFWTPLRLVDSLREQRLSGLLGSGQLGAGSALMPVSQFRGGPADVHMQVQ